MDLRRSALRRLGQKPDVRLVARSGREGLAYVSVVEGPKRTFKSVVSRVLARCCALRCSDQTVYRGIWDWLRNRRRAADAPSAILTAILIPPHVGGRTIAYSEKIGLRRAFSPSMIGVAACLTVDEGGRICEARFAVGGGITAPQRLVAAERDAQGQFLDRIDWPRLRSALAKEIWAPSDVFRSSAYRKSAAANAIAVGLGGGTALPRRESLIGWTSERALPPARLLASQTRVSRTFSGQRWRKRPDIDDKIAGRFSYHTDTRRQGMLVARLLLAHLPHARIRAIDASAASALPGVRAVITHRDVPGLNGHGLLVADQPVLCTDRVRHIGDVLAAVAAEDDETSRRALAMIKIDYEALPVVADPERALTDAAIRVHDAGNLQSEMNFERGDVSAAWPLCTHIVEDTYATPRQMHAYLETEGGYVIPEPDGGLTVCVGSQYGYRDRMQLARILGIAEERIRVISSPTGGAFGGKDGLTVQPVLCLLALKTGRPVRIHLDRRIRSRSGPNAIQ